MPQIVAAALAKSAMAAGTTAAAAGTTAAATTAATTAAGTAAAQTAALEAAKQAAIQTGMKQAGVEATKQAGIEAAKQAGVEATKQAGIEATKQAGVEAGKQAAAQATQQTGVEALKQGIFSGGTPGVSPTAGAPVVPPGAPATPLPPAGSPPPMTLEQQLAQIQAKPTDLSQFPRYEQVATGPGGQTPIVESATNIPSRGEFLSGQRSALPPEVTSLPSTPTPNPVDAASNAFNRSIAEKTAKRFATEEAAANMSPLQKGINQGLELVKQGAEEGVAIAKKYPVEVGLTTMALGQYMNQPDQPEKKQYKNTVDMSGFQPSVASVEPFKPSYEYQKYAAEGGLMKYAVGGPVETMSAQNAVGGNMMYPQAGLQTALYSNPMVQRPEAVNVISPGEGPAVGAYSGEQKFAEGGISEAQRREYGLKTSGERASRNLSKTYEEMSKEREKDLASLKAMGDKFDEGIVPRSRKQQLSSPFSAAMDEHARLAKKNKVPVAEMPKTSLGDIDTYMDTPIEAASGGIMGNLGGYSDGGRLLRGPGDGVSDSIPAVIGKRQPARLADGEFVIPARIVSELGNGSTEAGARKLYAMMERIQRTRKKSIGKKKVAVNSKADKHLPA